MWTIVGFVLIIFLLIVNMILLMGFNDTPQHNAMDVYNHEREPDLARSLHGLRTCVEDLDSRLIMLEDSFKYHIQSTDELKPKA